MPQKLLNKYLSNISAFTFLFLELLKIEKRILIIEDYILIIENKEYMNIELFLPFRVNTDRGLKANLLILCKK